MLNRLQCLVLAVGGLLLLPVVSAEVPQPQLCEQLHVVLGQQAGLDVPGQQWLDKLAAQSGLQLHAHPRADTSLRDFTAGVHDLWLGASPEVLRDSAARPLLPALWQEEYWLWFRAGELTSLQQLPQLEGLRGGYWRQQHGLGLLIALPEPGRLRLLPSPNKAVQLLLAGEIDYFLAGRAELEVVVSEQERLETLEMPLLVRPYYLAFSRNSACLDAELTKQLSVSIKKLQH